MSKNDRYALSVENGRHTEIDLPCSNRSFADRLRDCVVHAQEAATASHTAPQAKYETLCRCYELALSAADRHEELFKLLEERRIRADWRVDLFGVVLRLVTSDAKWRPGRGNEYARALQYLHHLRVAVAEVPSKLRELGGTRRAAEQLAQLRRQPANEPLSAREPATDAEEIWKALRRGGRIAMLRDHQHALSPGRQVLVGYVTRNGRMRVYAAIDARSPIGARLVRLTAQVKAP